MKRVVAFVPVALALALSLTAVGCKKDPADVPAVPEASGKAEKADPLAALSPEDRAAVLAQKVCPVTGEALGSMGLPIKLTIEGRDVFICCAGCEDPLREDPAKYFAILDKPAVADAEEGEAAEETADAGAATGDEPAGG